MFYNFELAIPAQTPESSPATLDCKLTQGIITEVNFLFPLGCKGLAHVVVNHLLHQLYPLNPEGSFASDNEVIHFFDRYSLLAAPYVLRMRGWNDDDSYAHTITMRLELAEGPPPEAAPATPGIIERLKLALGV